ncbi:Popeye domain-containing protein 3 [Triplophysa tibetana]|uniref:Popeye domain-containing protein 3 n=1 Tax=Triplophysa tibetana TaxID=1572043 RepID=A0A5A9N1K6_9TELE|nr:Popeye domain-containing protein 3 [Triplophysa tibetana]
MMQTARLEAGSFMDSHLLFAANLLSGSSYTPHEGQGCSPSRGDLGGLDGHGVVVHIDGEGNSVRDGVSLTQFRKIVACCDGDIHTIEKSYCFAMEGKTSIDKLSVLLSGRYVAWRRKKMYLLFAQHRYIAKIFALLVRNDIAEKLFSLNNAFDSRGFRYDLRLPSFCHQPEPEIENTHESQPEPRPAERDS